MAIEIKHFTGENLTQADNPPDPLMDGYIWPNDSIMILGSEKAGKSVLALQFAAALSSGSKFLDKYQCQKISVAYLQTEGKKDETAYRIQHMMNAVELDKTYFHRLYKKFFPLDIPDYFNALDNMLTSLIPKPQVLISDALYMFMAGDLNDNKDIRRFLYAHTRLVEKHNLTSLLVHHAKRDVFEDGKKLELGDKSSYGSVFLRANVDHIIFLEMQRDKTRTLTCETQRSGNVAQREELILIQPDPLCFEVKGEYKTSEEITLAQYKREALTKKAVCERTSLSETSVDHATRHLIRDKKIAFVGYTDGLYSAKIYKSI